MQLTSSRYPQNPPRQQSSIKEEEESDEGEDALLFPGRDERCETLTVFL